MIFVAFELRANRRQNRLSLLTSLDKGWQDINALCTQDGELAQIFTKGLHEPNSLSDEEAARFWWLIIQYVNHHKSVWTLLMKDGLDTHHEQWLRADISALYNKPSYRAVLRSVDDWLPEEFIAFADAQVQRQSAELKDWRGYVQR